MNSTLFIQHTVTKISFSKLNWHVKSAFYAVYLHKIGMMCGLCRTEISRMLRPM